MPVSDNHYERAVEMSSSSPQAPRRAECSASAGIFAGPNVRLLGS